MNRIFLSPDLGSGGGVVELTPPPPPIQEPPPPDPTKQAGQIFRDGREEGRKQQHNVYVEILKKYGLELVKASDGSVDIEKTIEKYRNTSLGASEIVDQMKREYNRKIEDLTAENSSLKQSLKQRDLDHRLSVLVAAQDPHNVALAMTALKQAYHVDEDQDGNLSITSHDTTPIFDKTNGRVATPDRVVEMFFDDNRYLVKPRVVGTGGAGARDLKGIPKDISNEELQQRYYNEKDPAESEKLRRKIMERAGYK